jgi:hypothetical protein
MTLQEFAPSSPAPARLRLAVAGHFRGRACSCARDESACATAAAAVGEQATRQRRPWTRADVTDAADVDLTREAPSAMAGSTLIW